MKRETQGQRELQGGERKGSGTHSVWQQVRWLSSNNRDADGQALMPAEESRGGHHILLANRRTQDDRWPASTWPGRQHGKGQPAPLQGGTLTFQHQQGSSWGPRHSQQSQQASLPMLAQGCLWKTLEAGVRGGEWQRGAESGGGTGPVPRVSSWLGSLLQLAQHPRSEQ